MNIACKIVFGSRLYGTFLDGISDVDHRGIVIPTREECFLNEIKDSINDPTEEDTQYWSLQYFLRLAAQGQSAAIELLAAPTDKIMINSDIWSMIRGYRKKFYTKNMYSFLGYSKSMSQKYSSRIDRLNETSNILNVLRAASPNLKLSSIWEYLPESLNAAKSINERNRNEDKRSYVVCGRELQSTVTISHAIDVIGRIHDSYGERVKKARNNELDYKALAHAFRAALQAKEIAETGDLVFPLRDANYLRDMRMGKINFLENELDKKLDDLIAETQVVIDKSDLPDKISKNFIDNLILMAYRSD